MGSIDEKTGDLLIWAAVSGYVNLFKQHFDKIEQPEIYINHIYDCDRSQKRTILTTACMHGHEDFVRYFLETYKPNLDILSDVIFEDDSNDQQLCLGVTALWAAAAADHLSIVKVLVEKGVNVNQTTSTNSTALRSACYNGNISMVHYLISKGADINISKKNNDTNLAVTVYRKHYELAKYLIEDLGCDVNQCDDDGRSPLFDAVNGGSSELAKFLLDHGAQNFRAKSDGMTPLMWAAEKMREDLVTTIGEYCSILEQIEAEELLGSALVCCDLAKRRPNQAIKHWSRALELRSLHNLPKILKASSLPLVNKREECQTIEQLEASPFDEDLLWIEALLIRERILGVKNGEFRYSVQYQGAVLLDNQFFEQGLSLWLYEAKLREEYHLSFPTQYFHNFISLFSEMLNRKVWVRPNALELIFDILLKQFETENADHEKYFRVLLNLITIMSKHLNKSNDLLDDPRRFHRRIRSIYQRKIVRQSDKSTLLHLSLNENIITDDSSIDRICRYPCYSTSQLLISCGADVNAVNQNGNTPLLTYVSNYNCENVQILELLYENGAHLDQVNSSGLMPIDITVQASLYNWLRSKKPFSLKCLCSQIIRKQKLALPIELNRELIDYVRKH